MQGVLKFDLPKDDNNYMIAVHAMDFALSCWDMDQFLRTQLKYGNKFETVDDALEKVREQLYKIMNEHNVSLEMIE